MTLEELNEKCNTTWESSLDHYNYPTAYFYANSRERLLYKSYDNIFVLQYLPTGNLVSKWVSKKYLSFEEVKRYVKINTRLKHFK